MLQKWITSRFTKAHTKLYWNDLYNNWNFPASKTDSVYMCNFQYWSSRWTLWAFSFIFRSPWFTKHCSENQYSYSFYFYFYFHSFTICRFGWVFVVPFVYTHEYIHDIPEAIEFMNWDTDMEFLEPVMLVSWKPWQNDKQSKNCGI